MIADKTRTDKPLPTVRPAVLEDATDIHHLIGYNAVRGNLLPRSRHEIALNINDFFVIEIDGKIAACAAIEIFSAELGEVRSVVVDDEYKKFGFGRRIIEHLINEAKQRGLRQVIALTYIPGFFNSMGFENIDFSELPEKVRQICKKCYKYNSCDETAVMLKLNTEQSV